MGAEIGAALGGFTSAPDGRNDGLGVGVEIGAALGGFTGAREGSDDGLGVGAGMGGREGLGVGVAEEGFAVALTDGDEDGLVGSFTIVFAVDGWKEGTGTMALLSESAGTSSPEIWTMYFLNFLTLRDPRPVTWSQLVVAWKPCRGGAVIVSNRYVVCEEVGF